MDLKIEKGALKSLLDLSRFRLAVEDALQLPVDLVTTQCSDTAFLKDIEKGEVLLYLINDIPILRIACEKKLL